MFYEGEAGEAWDDFLLIMAALGMVLGSMV
jgi:hypothetical protein